VTTTTMMGTGTVFPSRYLQNRSYAWSQVLSVGTMYTDGSSLGLSEVSMNNAPSVHDDASARANLHGSDGTDAGGVAGGEGSGGGAAAAAATAAAAVPWSAALNRGALSLILLAAFAAQVGDPEMPISARVTKHAACVMPRNAPSRPDGCFRRRLQVGACLRTENGRAALRQWRRSASDGSVALVGGGLAGGAALLWWLQCFEYLGSVAVPQPAGACVRERPSLSARLRMMGPVYWCAN
jgi:hypothetical protein